MIWLYQPHYTLYIQELFRSIWVENIYSCIICIYFLGSFNKTLLLYFLSIGFHRPTRVIPPSVLSSESSSPTPSYRWNPRYQPIPTLYQGIYRNIYFALNARKNIVLGPALVITPPWMKGYNRYHRQRNYHRLNDKYRFDFWAFVVYFWTIFLQADN